MPSDATPSRSALDLETWLRSPFRRRALIAVAVVGLAAVSTFQWMDVLSEFVDAPDWKRVFARRLLTWSLWGIALEPIVWLGRRLAGWIRYALPLLVVHATLSVGVAYGMGYVDAVVADALIGPPSWMGRGDRDRGGREERGDRSSRDRPEPNGDGARQRTNDESRRERSSRGRSRFGGRGTDTGIVLYWAILALGLSAQTIVERRDRERAAASLELRAARLEGELTRAQLERLESQLHPHFLFNALHSVGGLVREGDEQAALNTLSAIGDLLRATLDHGGDQEVPLSRELEITERYLDIERIRLGERLTSALRVEPEVLGARVPVLILLPLVENATQHGIAVRPEGGSLTVGAWREGSSIVLEVSDDGPGFPDDVLTGAANDDRKHIGLENTRERLAALYGDAGRIELSNLDEGGARVRVTIPAKDAAHGS